MSIYPVWIPVWWSRKVPEAQKDRVLLKFLLKYDGNICEHCGKRVKFNNAFMLHCAPYTGSKVWCRWCMARPSKKMLRKQRRKARHGQN